MKRLLGLAIPIVAVLATLAGAQGSAKDYERSRTYYERFSGLTVGERLDGVWLTPRSLVFRKPRTKQTWSFVYGDAESGAVGEAFDHERVASQLSVALEGEYDPTRLPLRILECDATSVTLLLEDQMDAFRVGRDGEGLVEVDPRGIPGATLEVTTSRRSRNSGARVALEFLNDSSETLDLLWLTREGRERGYGSIAPGERKAQSTMVGHVWLLRSEDGREAGPYQASSDGAFVLVGDDELQVAKEPSSEEREGAHSSTRKRRSESPDGQWLVLERDGALLLKGGEGDSEQPFEVPELEEDERYERITWSPDGSRVVALRVREGEEHTVHLIESSPEKQKQPKLHSFSYLKPGDRIDHKRIVLLDPSTLAEIPVDHALFDNPWSIKWLDFSPDGREVWFLYNQRGHQVLRYLAIDVQSGTVRTIVEDAPETFVDYSSKHYVERLDDRGELLWTSERTGWNHLYSVETATGEARALTSGEWVLREVERVDEEAGVVWFRAVGVYPDQDPYHVHYGRVALDGGGVTWLTEGDGTHSLRWGPERECYVDTWSRVDQPPVHELRRAADGSLATELSRADITRLKAAGWRAPQRFVAKGRDGETDIWGVIHVPTNFDPTKSYPVIESIYAGPQDHFVPKKFRRTYSVMQMAELGFVVVQIDGMGTNWRSKAFHDICWQNLGDSGFPDRIRWIRAAAEERPWMDLERVGIYGGSAGGQSSTRALLAHGDFYHVAVSDCGCHDNTMDKIWWNEQWMGWPIGEHYKEQSNVTQAHRLEGELLLIVGELDRNVDPASTMQVVDALVRADKDFDLLIIPGAGHGSAESPYGKRRRRDFFVEHLMGVEPRWE